MYTHNIRLYYNANNQATAIFQIEVSEAGHEASRTAGHIETIVALLALCYIYETS